MKFFKRLKGYVLLGSIFFTTAGGLNAQINYSQDFSGTSNWSLGFYPANAGPVCNTPGALGMQLDASHTSASSSSPDIGSSSNNGGNITLNYRYKLLTLHDANRFAAAKPGQGIVHVQYGNTTTGPWMTVQTIGSNHLPSFDCQNGQVTFKPDLPAGAPLYIRFEVQRVYGSFNFYLDDVAVIQGTVPSGSCSGAPVIGTAQATNAVICNTGGATELSLSSIPDDGSQISYAWESSADNVTYTPVAGATTSNYYATGLTSDVWFRCVATCGSSALSTTSVPVQVKVMSCQPAFSVSTATAVPFNSIQNTGTYFPVTGTSLSIGFPFAFMGNVYYTIRPDRSGYLSFQPNNVASNNGLGYVNNLTNPIFPYTLLAPLWDNTTEALKVRYELQGVAPNRTLVIEWIGLKFPFLLNSTTLNVNYQVRLHEGSHTIEYIYGNMDGHTRVQTGISTFTYLSYSYTTGLRNDTSSYYSQQNANTDYFTTTSSQNSLSILPKCNSSITFTPSATFSSGTVPVPEPPVNDNSTNAITLPVNEGPCTSFCGAYYSSVNATVSPEAGCSEDDDVWFTFTIPAPTTINVKLLGSGTTTDAYRPRYSVYDAAFTMQGGGCQFAFDNDGGTVYPALPAGQYYVRVGHAGAGSGIDGSFAICISKPPANDVCSGAIPLTVTPGFSSIPVMGTTLNATPSNSEPAGVSCSFSQNSNDVWYSTTIPASGNLVVQLDAVSATPSGSSYKLQVLTGACNTLVSIACSANTGQMPKIALTGQTPGSQLLFRVRTSTSVPNFYISAYDTTTSVCPPVAAGGACVYTNDLIASSENRNLYRWLPVFDANGHITAEINPNGNELGRITTGLNLNTGAVRSGSTGFYLDRNITITPELQPSSNSVLVRLYVKQTELAALATANGYSSVANPIVYKNADPCGNVMTATPTLLSSSNAYYPGGRYAQVAVPSFSTFYMGISNPLPVVLISFEGKNKGAVNELYWNTVEEKNFHHFELERSADGSVFTRIANIPGGNVQGSSYTYTDERPLEERNFYRLRMVDLDGSSVLASEIVAIKSAGSDDITLAVHPNPVDNILHITLSGKQSDNASIRMLDMLGKVVYESASAKRVISIDMHRLPAGTYLIRYMDDHSNIVTKVTKH